jgi:hypothetical protein
MMFNATFNNSSVISWRSVLLVEKSTDLSQVTDVATLVVIGIQLPCDHDHDDPETKLDYHF